MRTNLQQLMAIARSEVEATLESLPRPVRERAELIPVMYESVPSRQLVRDGVEPDILGLFVGESFIEEGGTTDPLPAQIILFLGNLWEEAEGDDSRFREEVHTTYLHELGHYLGLDEGDLEERGLE